MQILHGTWIPEPGADFIQAGQFYLWVETTEKQVELEEQGCYPRQLVGDELAEVLTGEFKICSPENTPLDDWIEPCYFLLPTAEAQPLPSLELSRYLEIELPETFEFEYWEVDCCPIACAASVTGKGSNNSLIPLLNELHFLTLHNLSELQLGNDLLFWFHFTQALKRVIFRDHYIP
ncbi:MAG: ATP-dependent helicase, partial [Cyanobacteria bacterium P01_C01_bin.118]